MTLVRPTLEYASSSWSPYTDTDIKRLEQIQKNAARFVCNDYNIATSTPSLVLKVLRLGYSRTQAFVQQISAFFINFIII